MKKIGKILLVIVIILILLPKGIGFSGGISGGEVFAQCLGVDFRVAHNESEPIADGISSSTYCVGLIYPSDTTSLSFLEVIVRAYMANWFVFSILDY